MFLRLFPSLVLYGGCCRLPSCVMIAAMKGQLYKLVVEVTALSRPAPGHPTRIIELAARQGGADPVITANQPLDLARHNE